MIVDTSVLVAILLKEDGFACYLRAMSDAESIVISAGTLLEASIVLQGRDGPKAADDLDALLREVGAIVAPVTESGARIAIEGWRRFGKGRHPASLNFGDCFAYALSHERGETLLFKGNDFSQTDVKAAL